MELSLAPLQGMTIAFYRNLYDQHFGGFDSYYTPFITTTDHHKKSPKLFKDLEPEYNNKELTVIPQLLGNDGDQFLDFASSIVDMGYDEINWNIGCPYPMVTNKIKGSGILPYPDKVKDFLDKVCADESFALTVKMRLGLLDPDEGMELIPILNDYPIKKVIIHGRIASQKYSGNIDHGSFKALYQESRHKVVYNGDIFSVKDFARIQQLYPDIREFMIGRGALIDPFLPLEIRGQHLSSGEKKAALIAFHKDVFGHYDRMLSGDKHKLDRMKEFWFYLSQKLDTSGKFMKKLKKCRQVAAYHSIVDDLFTDATL